MSPGSEQPGTIEIMVAESRSDRALMLAKRIESAKAEVQQAKTAVESAERKLQGLLEEFETLIGTRVGSEPAASEVKSRAGQIIALLKSAPYNAWSISDIAGTLKVDNIASLRATLRRLVNSEKIDQSRRGSYKAMIKECDSVPQTWRELE